MRQTASFPSWLQLQCRRFGRGKEGKRKEPPCLWPMSLSMPMPNGPRSVGPADLWEDYVSSAVPRLSRPGREGSQVALHFQCTLYPVSYRVSCIMYLSNPPTPASQPTNHSLVPSAEATPALSSACCLHVSERVSMYCGVLRYKSYTACYVCMCMCSIRTSVCPCNPAYCGLTLCLLQTSIGFILSRISFSVNWL